MANQQYDNTNRGALFRNKVKKHDKSPDYTGSLNVDGQEYWLNAWVNESKAGQKYFSINVRPKEDANKYNKAREVEDWVRDRQALSRHTEPEADPFDSEIPF